MALDHDLYNELAFYTLSLSDPAFIHQHLVDAYAAQHAGERTKPITVVFGLIGLYLYIEKNFTGKQVQRMHMRLARPGKQWPRLPLPEERGVITISAVAAAPPGRERDERLRKWCVSVWEAWKGSHQQIRALVQKELDIR